MPNSDRLQVPSVQDETNRGLVVKMPEQTPLQYVELHSFGEYDRCRSYADTFLSVSGGYWLAIIGIPKFANPLTYIAGAGFILLTLWFAYKALSVRKTILGRTVDIDPGEIGRAFERYFLGRRRESDQAGPD